MELVYDVFRRLGLKEKRRYIRVNSRWRTAALQIARKLKIDRTTVYDIF